MSREELERFLTRDGRRAIDQLFAEPEAGDDVFDVAEVLDRNLYAAVSDYDPGATLKRWLSLRFTGQRAQGQIDEQAVEDILAALRREITGAVHTKHASKLRLALVGFSQGSAVLHLVPSEDPETPPPGEKQDGIQQPELSVAAHEDELDVAVGIVTDLHKTAEEEGDVQRFTGQESLLRGFAALTDALDRHGLDMGITWRGATGRHTTAVLTTRGREYARRYLERAEANEILTVTGRIVALNISGSFDVKTGTRKNSPRYTIVTSGEESLLGLGLDLGQTIQVRVRKRTERNRFDVTSSTRYEFMSVVPLDKPLPFDESQKMVIPGSPARGLALPSAERPPERKDTGSSSNE